MAIQSKKVLIIQCDPYFSNTFLEVMKDSGKVVTLVSTLSDGENMLKKDLFDLVIIEYPVIIATTKMNEFLSQPMLANTPVLLVAKEKNFLDDVEGKNITKLNYDEIVFAMGEFVKKKKDQP